MFKLIGSNMEPPWSIWVGRVSSIQVLFRTFTANHKRICLYREIAIAIQKESGDTNGGNV